MEAYAVLIFLKLELGTGVILNRVAEAGWSIERTGYCVVRLMKPNKLDYMFLYSNV